jgi:hypothetical protein
MRRNRVNEIIEQTLHQAQQAAPALASAQTGGVDGPQGDSIMDDQGRLRWMWGVSQWTDSGRGDVFSNG